MSEYNPMIDRVAMGIVNALNLKTAIGESERNIARQALAALVEHWATEMRFEDARRDIMQTMMAHPQS